MFHPKLVSFKIDLADPIRDKDLPTFDNTKLTNINTCPTWGLIRYERHLKMSGGGRAMALEAGSACHEVFAAVRLLDLWKTQRLEKHANYHGVRCFGEERWNDAVSFFERGDDERTTSMNFCLSILDTGDFYDDPRDKRRTVANLEEACIAYIDRWTFGKWPIWVENVSRPEALVGIEVPFDLRVEFTVRDSTGRTYSCWVRFQGRMDGIHIRPSTGIIEPHENKTAARLDAGMVDAMDMLHQITGYIVACGTIIKKIVNSARWHGLAIPQPRSYDFGGVLTDRVMRYPQHIEQWAEWFWHTVCIWIDYKDDPVIAPKYTHSCNRYFRPCPFIPFCCAEIEDRYVMLEEMEHDPWTPLRDVSKVGTLEG